MIRSAAWFAFATLLAASHHVAARELRVCADPNNLPFSNQERQGFENRIIELLARELDAHVEYVWWAQRRGNVRETLKAKRCDVIPGVGSQIETLAPTRPYYRSSYVFVTRKDSHFDIESFEDSRLRTLTVGVQLVGDDSSNTPPAHELSKRGIVDNVRGYMVYGDYTQASPARVIVDDVAKGVLDVAVVWGPLAGYFAKEQLIPLELRPVQTGSEPHLPMAFDISMGVRRDDGKLKQALDAALARRADEIARILLEYGVPRSMPERPLTKTIQ